MPSSLHSPGDPRSRRAPQRIPEPHGGSRGEYVGPRRERTGGRPGLACRHRTSRLRHRRVRPPVTLITRTPSWQPPGVPVLVTQAYSAMHAFGLHPPGSIRRATDVVRIGADRDHLHPTPPPTPPLATGPCLFRMLAIARLVAQHRLIADPRRNGRRTSPPPHLSGSNKAGSRARHSLADARRPRCTQLRLVNPAESGTILGAGPLATLILSCIGSVSGTAARRWDRHRLRRSSAAALPRRRRSSITVDRKSTSGRAGLRPTPSRAPTSCHSMHARSRCAPMPGRLRRPVLPRPLGRMTPAPPVVRVRVPHDQGPPTARSTAACLDAVNPL